MELKKEALNKRWENIDEIRKALVVVVPPNAFTVKDYMEKYSLSHEIARKELSQMVNTEKLKMIKSISNGVRANFYYPKENS